MKKATLISLLGSVAALCQTPPTLTLQDAEAMAIKNHPQVLAAQQLAQAANQVITENRAAYFPTLNGEITGVEGNQQSRIGAGSLSASRIIPRFGQGVQVAQLISDSGRTPNLVASARLQAQSQAQNAAATQFDVMLAVAQDYYDVLRAQATIKVAEQTVAARQLLVNQVTTLAHNGLRSELDVGFADVNLSEAKLLLIRAQDALQSAYAELGRALGSSQPANYTLVEQPLPPGPP